LGSEEDNRRCAAATRLAARMLINRLLACLVPSPHRARTTSVSIARIKEVRRGTCSLQPSYPRVLNHVEKLAADAQMASESPAFRRLLPAACIDLVRVMLLLDPLHTDGPPSISHAPAAFRVVYVFITDRASDGCEHCRAHALLAPASVFQGSVAHCVIPHLSRSDFVSSGERLG